MLKISLFVKILISVTSLYFILYSISWNSIEKIFLHINIQWFIVAVILFWIVQIFSVLRCSYVVQTLGGNLSLLALTKAHFVGLWFNQVLPTALGGDAIKIALIRPQTGLTLAIRAIVIDRISGLMLLMFMLAIQLPLYLFYLRDIREIVWISIFSAVGIITIIFFAWLASLQQYRLNNWFSIEQMIRLFAELWLFSRGRQLWQQFWTSFIIHVNGILIYFFIGRALGVELVPFMIFLVVPIVFLISLMPFSFAGWGLREAGATWLFSVIGISYENSLAISVGFGILMIVAGMPGLIIYTFSRKLWVNN